MATKINNWDVHYKAMKFYLEHQPDLLNDLLIVLTPRLDMDKTIAFFSEGTLFKLTMPKNSYMFFVTFFLTLLQFQLTNWLL